MATLTSTGLTFSDSTTQSTQGIPLTGGTVTGRVALPYIKVNNTSGVATMRNVRQWNWSYTHAQNTSMYYVQNSNSFDDVTFQLNIVSYSGYILYGTVLGAFGGYGINYTTYGGAFNSYTPICDNSSNPGYGRFGLSLGGIYSGQAGVNVSLTIFGKNPITAINGTLQ